MPNCKKCKEVFPTIAVQALHDCEPPLPPVCNKCHIIPCECD